VENRKESFVAEEQVGKRKVKLGLILGSRRESRQEGKIKSWAAEETVEKEERSNLGQQKRK
jgi:hypothetical protein